MTRFRNVNVDPWQQKQETYSDYKRIPEDAVFACAYFVFFNPVDFVDIAFLRRTVEQDELWVAVWDYEIHDGLPDYSDPSQFDNFGCRVSIPRTGDEASASRRLLTHLFRSRVGFISPTSFIQSGIVGKSEFKGIIDGLKYELDQYAKAAQANRSEIVNVAEELSLSPEPTGEGPHSWRASCPRTNHPLWIDTVSNIFGCGWCRRKGGSDELREFVRERRAKK